MAAVHRIGSDRLTAEICETGAELQRLTDAAGRDWLWDGDPAFWTGRAPILFPIVGTLNRDRFRWRGESHGLPRHGFARRRDFTLAERDGDALVLRLDPDEATRAVWPFDCSLEMIFTIRAATLTMTARVTNSGADPMPASFGFHPALRWPLPGEQGKAGHVIRFDRPEPALVRRLDADGLLDPEPRPTPIEGDTLRLDDGLFAEDALILDRLESRRLAFEGPAGTRATIDFQGMPHLGLWTKPGAGYICIEPWQGHSDPAGFHGEIGEKPGMVMIPPGGQRLFSMAITIG
ncbi:aldose 1-epimerase family protein [Rhizorhabdus dicambivorans]|uniref:Aldose epimerase n=1 Tax=Rhizorhabdus dicambivorans TaxID=1850238 RepID=A0A2A4G034_9SPHN|nr:aldose 1-epimerase family protein [Rhizorhabdus dicambivorans]ATE63178.1 aldose epimerase [Rhizorhabdus dicambivorans]PCE43355.1 aldose epimerase [Rhizorhabdus dicambivorans]